MKTMQETKFTLNYLLSKETQIHIQVYVSAVSKGLTMANTWGVDITPSAPTQSNPSHPTKGRVRR